MDSRAVLRARIGSTLQELKFLENSLTSDGLAKTWKDDEEQIYERLVGRIHTVFGNLLATPREQLKLVRRGVDRNLSLSALWQKYRRQKANCAPLISEWLLLMSGAAARAARLDDGLCALADHLLDDLTNRIPLDWGRITIPAQREFYGDLAAVVRLRVPETTIWSLPVAAHEFGHFVVERTQRDPKDGQFEADLTKYGPLFVPSLLGPAEQVPDAIMDQRRAYLHEYLADIFAVYSLGPAYVYTCLSLRFDPDTANTDTDRHPSAAKRAIVILQTLAKMSGGAEYFGVVTGLREFWEANLAAAQPPGDAVHEAARIPLEKFAETLLHRLATTMPRVAYSSWPRSAQLAVQLRAPDYSALAFQPDDKLADILNAAWRARHDIESGTGGIDEATLTRRAKSACQALMGGICDG